MAQRCSNNFSNKSNNFQNRNHTNHNGAPDSRISALDVSSRVKLSIKNREKAY